MRFVEKYKVWLILVGFLVAFVVGSFSHSITGRTIGTSSEEPEDLNQSDLVSKIEKSANLLNKTVKEVFECKGALMECNKSLNKKEKVISNKTAALSKKKAELRNKSIELERCERKINAYGDYMNISYKMAKELEDQGICEDVDKHPISISNCFQKLEEDNYWEVLEKFKDFSNLLK